MLWLIDPMYFVFLAPALLLMAWAQWRVKSSYARAMQMPAPLSGAAAARYILDQAGLQDVPIEPTQGELSDHYDPGDRTVHLSAQVYHSRSMAAVGIAAHEVGHAIQHAHGYLPLVMRNIAVPAARFGPILFIVLVILGMLLKSGTLILVGLAAYSCIFIFQLVNLPVEFDASNRAKRVLSELNIVDAEGSVAVRDVLNAAGWTYVAATLQAFLTLMYYAYVLTGGSRSDRD
ncbi:MAG: zinc metallopeptidase [Planctomycetia bacterium]|nr:zinc metallopeptidase [Planctomycetia bacterium]